MPLSAIVLFVTVALMASLPGCSCGSAPCGDADCLPGEVSRGAIGRWTSMAADDDRVLVATYDQKLGDLVVVDVTDPAAPIARAVDGIPDNTPVYEPSGYRGGIEEPGPDVGAWTSIAISNGLARVAYQDRETGTLKYAYETKRDTWESFTVDRGDSGEVVGRYANLIFDAEGRPAIAYIATGIDTGTGQRLTELRLARGGEMTPGENDWNKYAVAVQPGACGGLCGAGEACIDKPEGQSCAATTSDCSATCGMGEACVSGACTAAYEAPTVSSLPLGTGLFAKLVLLPGGRIAVAYYDQRNRALAIAAESGTGTNEYVETRLHEGPGDRGLWTSAIADGAGVVHIAYQDAMGDQLLYMTWDSASGAPSASQVIDDGTRDNEFRTHPVGAGAAIFLSNGTPSVAYQDGLTADVYVATRAADGWLPTALSSGPLLDGFSIGVALHGGSTFFAWDRLDPAQSPVNGLFVQRQ